MVGAFAYGDTALVERFVTGTEVAVTVIDTGDGPRALPAVEIVPDGGLYDYAARYTAGHDRVLRAGPAARAGGRGGGRARGGRAPRPRLRDLSRTDLIVDAAGPRGSSRSTWHPG